MDGISIRYYFRSVITTENPLKIAIFTDTYFPQINGVVTSTETFVQSFRKQGHRVVIFAPDDKDAPANEVDVVRFPAVAYPFQPEYLFAFPFIRPVRNFVAYQFDIVHIQTPFSIGLYGLNLAKKHHIPVVHTYHTFFERYLHYIPILPEAWLVGAARWISRKFCNAFDYVFAPSIQMKVQLEKYKVTTPIEVIPTGIEFMDISERDRLSVSARFNIKKTETWAIYGGRLGREKNVYFMLDAFVRLAARFPDLKLLIVGDGPERKGMETQIQKAGFTDRVVFTGYLTRTHMITAFSLAKIYLFPSVTETQGLTLLECFSVGTPAVCIRSMGVEFLMGNDTGGFALDANLDDYVMAAQRLLQDPDLHAQKSHEARNRAAEFSATMIANRVIDIYVDLVKKYA